MEVMIGMARRIPQMLQPEQMKEARGLHHHLMPITASLRLLQLIHLIRGGKLQISCYLELLKDDYIGIVRHHNHLNKMIKMICSVTLSISWPVGPHAVRPIELPA